MAQGRQYLENQDIQPNSFYTHANMLFDFGISRERSIELGVEFGVDPEWAETRAEHAELYRQNKHPGSKSLRARFSAAYEALKADRITLQQALSVEREVWYGVNCIGRTPEQAFDETVTRLIQENAASRPRRAD